MAHSHGSPDTLEKHQHEVCNAFARAAAAMRDAAHTAESFSNWFSRVNNIQNLPVPPMFNNGQYNFVPSYGGPQQQQQQFQAPQPEQTGKKRKAAGDEVEGKKKRATKEKKPKDANAPKRPPSAYLLFQNEVRKDVKGEHPDMPYAQLLAEISKLWHALTPEEKAPYVQATADSKVLYEKAKAEYEGPSPTDATAKPAASNSKTSATAPAALTKTVAKPVATSDDDEESSESSSEEEEEEEEEQASANEEEEVEEEPESAPEPPRKKSKKEVPKAPTPPPAKVEKKKNGEGKKKKKVAT